MSLNSFEAKAKSAAGSPVTVYTVPAIKQFANVSLNLLNFGPTPVTIKVGITVNATMTPGDSIEHNIQLAGNGGQLRRTSLYMSPNEKLIVEADTSTIAIRAVGLEQN